MFQLQQHIKQAIQRTNRQRKRQAAFDAAQNMAGVEGQQGDTGAGGNHIGRCKAQMLGQADQQQKEAAQRRANKQILHGVHAQFFQDFKQTHGHKGQDHKQDAVFGGAVAERVDVDGVDEFCAHAFQARAAGLDRTSSCR